MRCIEVDFNRLKGKFDTYASFCIGAGHAAEVLRKDFDCHLEMASKE